MATKEQWPELVGKVTDMCVIISAVCCTVSRPTTEWCTLLNSINVNILNSLIVCKTKLMFGTLFHAKDVKFTNKQNVLKSLDYLPESCSAIE
jgi:hypothetical protein